MNNELIILQNILSKTAVYVPENCEGIRVDCILSDNENSEKLEEWYLIGTGEETGEQYQVYFNEIDFNTAMFYELKLIEIE